MSPSKFNPLLVILVLQVLLFAECDGRRLCGPELRSVLEFLCDGNYATLQQHNNVKRSADYGKESAYINDEPEVHPRFMNQFYPYVYRFGSTSALSAGARTRITKRGIVDECCLTSCTRKTLLRYCAAPS